MNLVEEALRSQKKVWIKVSSRVSKEQFWQGLPPEFPKRIILFGVGSSYFSARLTALSLIRENLSGENQRHFPILCCSSVGVGLEVIPQKGDWAFAFSHRGKTPATLNALEKCAKAGAFPILVASEEVSLPASARFLIPTSPLEKCEPHTMGMTSAICAVTSLFLGNTGLNRWKELAREKDPDLAELQKMLKAPPTLLLGEWEAEWIAREISLKLIEVAQIPTRVFSTEEFFHGPQALSEMQNDKIWHLSREVDSRRNQIQVEYSVPVSSKHSLAWVSSLVQLQWAVLALRGNRQE
jgi:fructoselysine-6-P-deglycase FrlB-like protein